MLQSVPMTVRTEGRLYTTQWHREQLDAESTCGTTVSVGLTVVQRDTDWNGRYAETVTFRATVGTSGEIRIPAPVRRRLGLHEGDPVRVTARVV
jgi:AbrB family looped-hinge helix DNA binding protein